MRVSKSREERTAQQEQLTMLLARRNELRQRAYAISYRIKLLRNNLAVHKKKDDKDGAKIEFVEGQIKQVSDGLLLLKDEIKATTKEINRIKLQIRYYENNDLDILPFESTLAYRLFRKRYADLTADELKEYNRVYFQEVTKEKRKLKKKLGGI